MRTTGLYAILDVDAFRAKGVELVGEAAAPVLRDVASALLAAAPSVLQLRAKHEDARVVLAMLRALAPLARAAGVPLAANDRVDLAILAGASIVHLGQDDLPLEDARRIAGGLSHLSSPLAFGRSTHDDAQLAAELAAGPDYVAFGPVFGTASKRDPSPTVGLDRLARAVAQAREGGRPLVAIGGISRANAASVVGAGARWAAAISDLVAVAADGRPDLPEIERRARDLDAALRSAS
jgi:thiamine-phosphate pyrophosphorylase